MASHTIWWFNFSGWILFTLSALAFLWGAVAAGDAVAILASVLFLVACTVFLIPVWAQRPGRRE